MGPQICGGSCADAECSERSISHVHCSRFLTMLFEKFVINVCKSGDSLSGPQTTIRTTVRLWRGRQSVFGSFFSDDGRGGGKKKTIEPVRRSRVRFPAALSSFSFNCRDSRPINNNVYRNGLVGEGREIVARDRKRRAPEDRRGGYRRAAAARDF